MATTAYDGLKSAVAQSQLGELPAWSELNESAQELTFRVLKRLGVARALDSGDAFSAIEVEAGLGEDAALRNFLLSTAVVMVAEGMSDADESAPVGRTLGESLGPDAQAILLQDCWVYRDSEMVAWSPLHAVETGFDRTDDDDLKRLTEARKSWDAAEPAEKLALLGDAVVALARQYLHGSGRDLPRRKIDNDESLMRALAEAAREDRVSLLSDGAFEALDAPSGCIGGVDVSLAKGEAYVRRSDFTGCSVDEWTARLVEWQPGGGDGETAFVWDSGFALSVKGGTVAAWLERCAQALLAGLLQARERAA